MKLADPHDQCEWLEEEEEESQIFVRSGQNEGDLEEGTVVIANKRVLLSSQNFCSSLDLPDVVSSVERDCQGIRRSE